MNDYSLFNTLDFLKLGKYLFRFNFYECKSIYDKNFIYKINNDELDKRLRKYFFRFFFKSSEEEQTTIKQNIYNINKFKLNNNYIIPSPRYFENLKNIISLSLETPDKYFDYEWAALIKEEYLDLDNTEYKGMYNLNDDNQILIFNMNQTDFEVKKENNITLNFYYKNSFNDKNFKECKNFIDSFELWVNKLLEYYKFIIKYKINLVKGMTKLENIKKYIKNTFFNPDRSLAEISKYYDHNNEKHILLELYYPHIIILFQKFK